jgi:hypothetical protein
MVLVGVKVADGVAVLEGIGVPDAVRVVVSVAVGGAHGHWVAVGRPATPHLAAIVPQQSAIWHSSGTKHL